MPLVRAVTSAAKHAMVVADLPFGSYQASPQQALATATRFMKEGLAHAVKLEGGKPMVPEVELLVRAGIPVMGHIGFTPQSEHVLGGYQVQGRGDSGDRAGRGRPGARGGRLLRRRHGDGARLRWRPGSPRCCSIPTIGIGAGPDCDAQVLVWQDMAGLRGGRAPRFVKKYADLRGELPGCRRRMPRRSPPARSRRPSTPSRTSQAAPPHRANLRPGSPGPTPAPQVLTPQRRSASRA